MKTRIYATVAGVATAVLLWMAVKPANADLIIPASLPQQSYAAFIVVATPTNITAGATSNLVVQSVNIRPGRGLALSVINALGMGNSTSNQTYYVNLSQDGTNYCTTSPLSFSFALNGTNGCNAATNFPFQLFDGFSKAAVWSIKNGDTATNVNPGIVELGVATQ